jgi:phospholipid transport system transporter-binding protein
MIVKQADRYFLEGPVSLENVGKLIDESAAFEGGNVVVDLARVTSADSSALSLLLEWARRLAGSGRKISFANVGPDLKSLAQLYGVIDLIPFVAD